MRYKVPIPKAEAGKITTNNRYSDGSSHHDSRYSGVVTFLGHEFRRGVDIVQLHFSHVSAEKQPLLTLRKGHRSEGSVLFRVSICPNGPEFGVNELPVETSPVQTSVLRESGAIQQARRDGRRRAALVPRLGTSMRVEERKGGTNHDGITADGVLLPQIISHDRVQRHFWRLRHQRSRLQLSQNRRWKICAAAAGFLPDKHRRLGRTVSVVEPGSEGGCGGRCIRSRGAGSRRVSAGTAHATVSRDEL